MTKTDVTKRLVQAINELTEGRVPLDIDTDGADSIRRLGLDSLAMVELLVAVEDVFGIEWDVDAPADAVASFDKMSAYIVQQIGAPC